jgi:hypothetical protein
MMDEKLKIKELEIQKTDNSEKIRNPKLTNPIAKKLLQFHHEKTNKFSVKDLFRN